MTYVNPEDWVDLYGDYLFVIALARLNNRHKAEDAVQETLLAAWKSREKYSGKVEFRFWLRGILRNKIVDIMRKGSREIFLDKLGDFGLEGEIAPRFSWVLESSVESWGFDPSHAMRKKEFWQQFKICLESLQEPLRSVYLMKEIERVDSKTVCEYFDISQANLWVMMHRARKQLKQCLKQNWGTKFGDEL